MLIGRGAAPGIGMEEAKAMLMQAIGAGQSARDAARQVAQSTGLPRRTLYQLAIGEDR